PSVTDSDVKRNSRALMGAQTTYLIRRKKLTCTSCVRDAAYSTAERSGFRLRAIAAGIRAWASSSPYAMLLEMFTYINPHVLSGRPEATFAALKSRLSESDPRPPFAARMPLGWSVTTNLPATLP